VIDSRIYVPYNIPMPLRKRMGRSTPATGRGWLNLPRWAWLLILGLILFVIQFMLPDPVSGAINNLLHRSDISLYTGLGSFLKALLVIWKVSGIGLFVAGIVDLFHSRRR
jgi:hypothetical protein